ncbi:uncharacterized [Tachysurus ichikawai]
MLTWSPCHYKNSLRPSTASTTPNIKHCNAASRAGAALPGPVPTGPLKGYSSDHPSGHATRSKVGSNNGTKAFIECFECAANVSGSGSSAPPCLEQLLPTL